MTVEIKNKQQIYKPLMEWRISDRRKKIAAIDRDIKALKNNFIGEAVPPRKNPLYRKSIRCLLAERRALSSYQRYNRLVFVGKIKEERR